MVDHDEAVANERPRPSLKFGRNFSGLLRDGAKLLDLQVQLLAVDVKDFWDKAKLGIVVLIVGAVTLLAALPVILLGFGYLLHNVAGWSEQLALLTVGGIAVVLAGVGLYWTLKRLTYAGSKLTRSQAELQENIQWFREALHGDTDH